MNRPIGACMSQEELEDALGTVSRPVLDTDRGGIPGYMPESKFIPPHDDHLIMRRTVLTEKQLAYFHQYIHLIKEEAGEVSKATSKIGRFGIHCPNGRTGEMPLEALQVEFNDLVAVLYLLADLLGVPRVTIDPELIAKKQAKVAYYIEKSRALGLMGNYRD